MKNLTQAVLVAIMGLILYVPNQLEPNKELREIYKIDPIEIDYTFKDHPLVKDIEAVRIIGAELFGDTRMTTDIGTGSCQASCHVKGNHLAPKGLQIGTGGYTDFDGVRKPDPYFPQDLIFDQTGALKAPNSYQSENLVFRKAVLHNGVTDAAGQASEEFGFNAHNLDWTMIAKDKYFQKKCQYAFHTDAITEECITIALVTFQESCVTKGNKVQDWANGGYGGIKFNKFIKLFHTECYSTCHSGKGLDGQGLIKSDVVAKDGTDLSFLKTLKVTVRSPYNNDAYDCYGWACDYKSRYAYFQKHMEIEGFKDHLTDEEIDLLYFGIVRYMND